MIHLFVETYTDKDPLRNAELREVGYSLLNPCLNLRCHHRHTSGVRNYDDATPRLTGPIAHVHPCSL